MIKKDTAKNCFYCKIVDGKIEAHKIYEDPIVIAFLDVRPISGGHAVVIPKKHEQYIWDLDQSTYLHLMDKAREISLRLRMIVKPLRVGVVVDGSDVPHAHYHLIPLKKALKTTLDYPEVEEKPSKKLLAELTQKLKIQ